MMQRVTLWTCVMGVLVLAVGGCQQAGTKTTAMTARPIELDRLDMWAGQWQTASEMKLAGTEEVNTATGTDTYRWACGRRVLINEWEISDDEGRTEGIGIWTWDADDNNYRIYQVNSKGTIVEGTATYDPDNKTWRIKGKGKDPDSGETRVVEATATMPNMNTIRIEGESWRDAWKLRKRADFNIRSERQ